MSETDEKLWEDRLREMLSGLLSRRLDPLASELSSLQDTFDAACARIVAEARSADNMGLDAVASEIRNQFSQSERQFTGELDSLRMNHAFASRTERATLNSAIAEIDRQRTQAGVLAAMILGASGFAPRVALFVVRSGNVVGWRGAGFGQEGDEASLSILSVPIEDRTLLSDALARRQSVSVGNASGSGYLAFLGTHRQEGTTTSTAVPLIVRDKAAAVLYADTRGLEGIDVQPLEAIVRVASMAIELLPLRRSTEPFTTDLPPPRIFTSSLETAPVTNRLEAAPAVARWASDDLAQSTEDAPPSPSASIVEASTGPPSIGANGYSSSAGVSEPNSIGNVAAERVETSIDPVGSTDPRAHLNARRFARFLIGQIKLYQPSRVAEGCRRGDLYDRLRDEIETSRRLYERHVPRPITSEFDYFYHELVINLAEGDATKLGRNFPSSQS